MNQKFPMSDPQIDVSESIDWGFRIGCGATTDIKSVFPIVLVTDEQPNLDEVSLPWSFP